jgi:hypothetical protein
MGEKSVNGAERVTKVLIPERELEDSAAASSGSSFGSCSSFLTLRLVAEALALGLGSSSSSDSFLALARGVRGFLALPAVSPLALRLLGVVGVAGGVSVFPSPLLAAARAPGREIPWALSMRSYRFWLLGHESAFLVVKKEGRYLRSGLGDDVQLISDGLEVRLNLLVSEARTYWVV